MKPLLLTLCTLIFSAFGASSQNEADQWYFGTYAHLDFSGGAPVVGMGSLTTSEGTASMSYPNGEIMFYTNGVDVWDSSGTIMPNGSGLMGDVSTTQSAIIIPNPASNTQYYIFTIAADGSPTGLRYSIVDMTLNAGLGNITGSKNILLTDSLSEKICAVKGVGGDNYWILTHKWGTNEFYAYHLTTTGIQVPVVSQVGTVHSTSTFQNTYGQMKFNLCGDRIALALGYMDLVELYDFNQNSGVVSNPISMNLGDNVYGVEFSPSGDLLYATCYDPNVTLAQYDITQTTGAQILASKVPLSLTSDLYALQLAPDGKIYVSRSFSSSFLGVIDSPNTSGSGCNYNDNAIDLDPNFNGVNGALGLPAFVVSYLGTGVNCTDFSSVTESAATKLRAYPNPSNHEFELNIQTLNQPANVFVYDASGKLLESFIHQSTTLRFGKNYLRGMYTVRVLSDNYSDSFILVKE